MHEFLQNFLSGKRQVETQAQTRKGNIKTQLREMWCESVECIPNWSKIGSVGLLLNSLVDSSYIIARNLFNILICVFHHFKDLALWSQKKIYMVYFIHRKFFLLTPFSSQRAVGYVLRRRNHVRFNIPSICACRRAGERGETKSAPGM